MVIDRAFVLHIKKKIFLAAKPFLFYQSQGHLSRSNIKVTVFEKKNGGCEGISISQTQFFLLIIHVSIPDIAFFRSNDTQNLCHLTVFFPKLVRP